MTALYAQELVEKVFLGAMNGGPLAGMVFRHSDTGLANKKTAIVAKAGEPVPQLEGPKGFRIEVEIEIRTDKPAIGGKWHAIVLSRILDVVIVRRAAMSAGMTLERDLYIIDEEIGGDGQETNNLRKRFITVPVILR